MKQRQFLDRDLDIWKETAPGMLMLTARADGSDAGVGIVAYTDTVQTGYGPLTEVRTDDLDPARVERALRLYVAELAPEKHAEIEDHPADGIDRYCDEAEFFLRCWEATA
ncbi:hypothetical protein [Streptomyces sp. SM8]|uniref:hypothetical protein n=1 Tax=Streptomyces sp. SM8 TaxID=1195457 RepID=UPI0002831126|nr:hypothetical protein [Streptomyces sp. SM8]